MFINEPLNLNDLPSKYNIIDLKNDLGTYFTQNYKSFTYFIARRQQDENLKFNGWIQDFKFFLFPLTNYEIYELFSGRKINFYFKSECKCSHEYPRNENEYSFNCLTNSHSNNSILSRLSQYARSLEFLNDNNLKTKWISSQFPTMITITIDLSNGVYLLDKIEIWFSR
jgi:hypothetical protein